jgi:hypothetical protein
LQAQIYTLFFTFQTHSKKLREHRYTFLQS